MLDVLGFVLGLLPLLPPQPKSLPLLHMTRSNTGWKLVDVFS